MDKLTRPILKLMNASASQPSKKKRKRNPKTVSHTNVHMEQMQHECGVWKMANGNRWTHLVILQ